MIGAQTAFLWEDGGHGGALIVLAALFEGRPATGRV
jgi:hypothetical protein